MAWWGLSCYPLVSDGAFRWLTAQSQPEQQTANACCFLENLCGCDLLGGRKHAAANRKRYSAFPTGNDCGKSCSDLALLFHPHSQARTDKFCLWLFCTTLHHDNAEQSAWLTALVWNTGWELFPLYLQIKLKLSLCLQPRVATLDCLALLDLGWWHTLTLEEESLQGKPLPKFSNPFATLGCTTP